MSEEVINLEPKGIINNTSPKIIYNIISNLDIEINIDILSTSDFIIYGNVDITKEITDYKLSIHLAKELFIKDNLYYASLREQPLNVDGSYSFIYKDFMSSSSLSIVVSKAKDRG